MQKKSGKKLVKMDQTSNHTDILEDIDCSFDIDAFKYDKQQKVKKVTPQKHHQVKNIQSDKIAPKTPTQQQTMQTYIKASVDKSSAKNKKQGSIMDFFQKAPKSNNQTNQQLVLEEPQQIQKKFKIEDSFIDDLSYIDQIPQSVIEEQNKIFNQIRATNSQEKQKSHMNEYPQSVINEQNEILNLIMKQKVKKLSNQQNEPSIQEQYKIYDSILKQNQKNDKQSVERKTKQHKPEDIHKIIEEPVYQSKFHSKGKKDLFLKKEEDQSLKMVNTDQHDKLKGMKIVISGLINAVPKEKLKQKLIDLGARVTGSVSGKTSVLIVGEKLEDGRMGFEGRKYQSAQQKKVRIVREDQLDEWMQENVGMSVGSMFGDSEISKLYQKSLEISDQKKWPVDVNMSWTDRYQPHSLDELVGHQSSIEQLREWLTQWGKKDLVQKEQKRNNFMMIQLGRFQVVGDKQSKACLISGPPGIGKSSSVKLIAQVMGYQTLETNASDLRNKKSIKNQISDLVGNRLIFQNKTTSKFIIIMDEVDGMTGSDRGGIQQLIECIKNTMVPIICICNDNENQKLKSLLTHCYHIRFNKPSEDQVALRMETVSQQEKLNMSREQLRGIANVFDCDLRQSINFLQMMTFQQKNTNPQAFQKDQSAVLNVFDGALILFKRTSRDSLRLRQKLDLFFLDYDLMPLIIHDSLLSSMKKQPIKKETKKMTKKTTKDENNDNGYTLDDINRMAQATELIAIGDVINKRIRYQQQWGLMPSYGMVSTIMPCELVGESINFPRFPEFLGKFSSRRKLTREILEIKNAIARTTYNCSVSQVKFEYGPMLFKSFKNILKNKSRHQDPIEAAVELMELYNLNPEDLKNNLMDIQFNPLKTNLLVDIDASIKTSLTKLYNKRHQVIKVGGKKAKKNAPQNTQAPKAQYNPSIGEEAPILDELEQQQVEQQEQEQDQESQSQSPAKKPKITAKKAQLSKKISKKQISQFSESEDSSLLGFIVDDESSNFHR